MVLLIILGKVVIVLDKETVVVDKDDDEVELKVVVFVVVVEVVVVEVVVIGVIDVVVVEDDEDKDDEVVLEVLHQADGKRWKVPDGLRCTEQVYNITTTIIIIDVTTIKHNTIIILVT